MDDAENDSNHHAFGGEAREAEIGGAVGEAVGHGLEKPLQQSPVGAVEKGHGRGSAQENPKLRRAAGRCQKAVD